MTIVRFLIVIAIAALMGAVGMCIIGLWNSEYYYSGIALSVAIWGCAALFLKGMPARVAVGFGAVSPFVGGFILGNVMGLGYAAITFFISIFCDVWISCECA